MNPIAALPAYSSIPLADGVTARLRPVVPADAGAECVFVASLSPTSRRNRFHGAVNGLTDGMARYLTCVDQRRHVALVLTVADGGTETVIGDARFIVADDGETAEFAIAIADRWQGCGLARRLLDALVACARTMGLRWLVGEVLATNQRMLAWAQRSGFAQSVRGVEAGIVRIERAVDEAPEAERSPAFLTRLIGLARRCFGSRRSVQPAPFLAPF